MSPLMILSLLDCPVGTSPGVHSSALLTDCGTFLFVFIKQPAEYVINTSLFAIALAHRNTC